MKRIICLIFVFNILFAYRTTTSFINYTNTNVIRFQVGQSYHGILESSKYINIGFLFFPNINNRDFQIGLSIEKDGIFDDIYNNIDIYTTSAGINLQLPKFGLIKPTVSTWFQRIYNKFDILVTSPEFPNGSGESMNIELFYNNFINTINIVFNPREKIYINTAFSISFHKLTAGLFKQPNSTYAMSKHYEVSGHYVLNNSVKVSGYYSPVLDTDNDIGFTDISLSLNYLFK